MYVRDTLKVNILAKSDTTRREKPEVPEYLACRVWHGDGPPILVFLIYRPPTVPFLSPDNRNKYKNTKNKLKIKQSPLITDFCTFCPQYSHEIVMWDLNAYSLSKGSEAKSFRDLINELSLKVVNQGPTNHVRNSHTWIDVICVDDNDELLAQGQKSSNFNDTHDLFTRNH